MFPWFLLLCSVFVELFSMWLCDKNQKSLKAFNVSQQSDILTFTLDQMPHITMHGYPHLVTTNASSHSRIQQRLIPSSFEYLSESPVYLSKRSNFYYSGGGKAKQGEMCASQVWYSRTRHESMFLDQILIAIQIRLIIHSRSSQQETLLVCW